MTLTLTLTTPLPPTSAASFLPRNGANRRHLRCSPRSSGVLAVRLEAGVAQRETLEPPMLTGWWKNRWWDRALLREETSLGKGGREGFWWGESRECTRRGRGHGALRTRRTSEWVEKDGCFPPLYLFLPLSNSLFLSLSLPSPVAPSLFPSIIFLTSTLLVERQRNRARWRGKSRLTTR